MKFIVLISLLFAFVSCANNIPTQGATFCGSYADIDSVRVTIVNTTSTPNILALIGKIHGFYVTCGQEAVTFAPDGTVTLPSISDPKDCLGGVLARQNIPFEAVKISYDGNSNTASIEGPGGIQFMMSPDNCASIDKVHSTSKATASPSGSYCGSISNVFKGKIQFNSLTSVDIMGNADDDPLSCSNEAIKLSSDNVISLVDISKSSDCMAQYLAQFGIQPSDFTITYDGDDDSIVVKTADTPVLNFAKCTEYEVHFEVPKAKKIKDLYRVGNTELLSTKQMSTKQSTKQMRLGDPAGSYCGSYQNIATLKATVLSKTEASLVGTLYGSPLSCPQEAAEYDAANSSIVFPNIYAKDDCLGSQLASFSIPPQAFLVTYDAKANTLNATILSEAISVILSPCSLEATPKGSYCGGIESIISVNCTVITLQDVQLVGNIGGTIAKCDAETVKFNTANDDVNFPNIQSDNDCLGNMLRSYSIDPSNLNVHYYPNADVIGVSLPVLFADFNLTKSC